MKISIKESRVKIDLKCDHKSGILYIVPSESSWVCKDENLDSHSLSGFFSDIVDSGDEKTMRLMQKWGVYYRNNSFTETDESNDI